MSIEKLPALSQLAYVDCQYFRNEGGKGTTKNRLKFQYTTTQGEEGHFFVNLSCNSSRNLRAKVKTIAGKANADAVMKQYRDFQNDYDAVYMGYRVVERAIQTRDGIKKNYRADQFTICWFFLKDDQFYTHVTWGGDTLSMPAMVPTSQRSANQSLFISYFHAQHDLNQRIADKFAAQQVGEDQGEQGTEGAGTCESQQPASTDWQSGADQLGTVQETQVADYVRPLVFVDVPEQTNTGELVDHGDWSVWQPLPVSPRPTSRQRTIRL